MKLEDRLQNTYAGILYDVMRMKGKGNCVLPNYLRPLNIEHKVAGRAFTISGKVDTSLTKDESLLKWCEMLSKIPTDSFPICQPNDNHASHMGELSSETLTFKKVRGYIVDGGCRDTSFISSINFPVWSKYYTPVDIVSYWAPDSFEQPITIGGVTINNGDYIYADRDGVVVIPEDMAEEVVTHAEELIGTENLVRKAILEGTDPVDAYLKYRKF